MLYKLRADVVTDESGKKRVTYGVDVFNLVRSAVGVFADEQQALAFLELCNEGQPCGDHLTDIIEDVKEKTAHP